MKTRLLVMNGQRIVQEESGANWNNTKVEKAGEIKPGIYSLATSKPADKTKGTVGVILHVDKQYVYQQDGRGIVVHEAKAFDTVNHPQPGTIKAVNYDEKGRAVAQDAQAQIARSLKR